MNESDKTKTIETWVSDYSDMLYSYVVSRVSNSAEAEDLVQDTFVSAYKNIDSFKGDSAVKTWLFAILKNKIIDHYRKQSTKKEFASSDAIENSFFEKNGHWNASAPKQLVFNLDKEQENKELLFVIENCKNKLPKNFQAVFTLKYFEDMDSDEICKQLGISPSNYWVMIHRAKLIIRDCIEKNWTKL